MGGQSTPWGQDRLTKAGAVGAFARAADIQPTVEVKKAWGVSRD